MEIGKGAGRALGVAVVAALRFAIDIVRPAIVLQRQLVGRLHCFRVLVAGDQIGIRLPAKAEDSLWGVSTNKPQLSKVLRMPFSEGSVTVPIASIALAVDLLVIHASSYTATEKER